MEFEVGDIVELKSGGPLMTITAMDPSPRGRMLAWCRWFSADNNVNSQKFPLEALRKRENAA